MAISAALMIGALNSAGQAFMPGSSQFPKIATAVGTGIKSWISTITVNGATAGVAGSGTVQGKVLFSPAQQIIASLSSIGFAGPTTPKIASAVQSALDGYLNSSTQYAGASAGVAAGTDISKVTGSQPGAIAIPFTLAFYIYTSLTAQAATGPKIPQLAQGLANGIAIFVATGTGVGGVVPIIAAPGPAAGTSISVMF